MATILSVLNYKGGVAKTTTTANLGTALWILGKRVLLIDTDPQCDLTFLLGFDGAAGDETFNEWFMQQNDEGSVPVYVRYDAIDKRYDSKERLYYIPSSRELRDADMMLAARKARERILKRKLKPLQDAFDYILIDCSPSLGLLTVNSLAAANSVMIPVQCQYFALEGLGKLLNTIKIIQKRLNTALEIEGFVLTMYDGRVRLSNQVVAEVRKHFEEMVFDTLIQQNVKLAEAPSYGQPVILYDAECRGSVNYLSLANELLEKNKK